MVGDVAQKFLIDNSILEWDRPLREGYFRLSLELNGSTQIVRFLDLETIKQSIGNYVVVGSAAKYLADIARIGDQMCRDGNKLTAPIERQILFSGGLQIYKSGMIPGTEIMGDDLVRQGKIWVATEPTQEYEFAGGLDRLVFGENSALIIERIDWLVSEYQRLEDRTSQESARRDLESYRSGLIDGEEGRPPIFGSRIGLW